MQLTSNKLSVISFIGLIVVTTMCATVIEPSIEGKTNALALVDKYSLDIPEPSGLAFKKLDLNFSVDYSGVYYDDTENNLWIVSDESSTVTKCDMEGNPIQSYYLGVKQAEGIAVDTQNKLIYVLSDSNEELYVYQLND